MGTEELEIDWQTIIKLREDFRKFLSDNVQSLNYLEAVYHKMRAQENIGKVPQTIALFDYLPKTKDELWRRSCVGDMQIPVGRDRANEEVTLEISQRDAQNATIVVGIPGSGKSVFLNTIITSIAYNYSPKQVDLYLIGLSGVDFNVYAPKNLDEGEAYVLPHAKVIMPESNREFGLSVLRRVYEEGCRRQQLLSEADVSDFAEYWDYCTVNGLDTLPRVILIIDEFQKFFEGEFDRIALEAEKLIKIIVKDYRRFGINLILSTNIVGPYASKINLGDIGNRVAFAWSSSDGHNIFKGHEPFEFVMNTGDCIYNKRGGAEGHNKVMRSYYVSPAELRRKLKSLYDIAEQDGLVTKNTIVFRGDAKVYLRDNKALLTIEPVDSPKELKVYVGDNIDMSGEHVSVPLLPAMVLSDDNILIIGGQPDVSERIAMNCARSLHAFYMQEKAKFFFFDYTSPEDPYHNALNSMYSSSDDVLVPVQAASEMWLYLKEEIEHRQQHTKEKAENIFITVVALQYAHSMFTKNYKPSDDTAAITFVLEQGPRVGVYTILQVDTLKSLAERIATKAFDFFNHRIALQMRSEDSEKVLGSKKANELYVEGKESSKNRAFYFNKKNSFYVKFRPYELDI